ncbi:MAG: zf-HC2 domain-containing protein [Candidatus Omnitrophica bacterium]|nr:zf-HC2 domain-containing protein [Candidatus Omnitrophota bacterium]
MDRPFNCEEIFEVLSGYIDREIDTFMREILEEHLKECERCFSLLHTLEKTIAISRQANRRKRVPRKVINRIYYEIRIRYQR